MLKMHIWINKRQHWLCQEDDNSDITGSCVTSGIFLINSWETVIMSHWFQFGWFLNSLQGIRLLLV